MPVWNPLICIDKFLNHVFQSSPVICGKSFRADEDRESKQDNAHVLSFCEPEWRSSFGMRHQVIAAWNLSESVIIPLVRDSMAHIPPVYSAACAERWGGTLSKVLEFNSSHVSLRVCQPRTKHGAQLEPSAIDVPNHSPLVYAAKAKYGDHELGVVVDSFQIIKHKLSMKTRCCRGRIPKNGLRVVVWLFEIPHSFLDAHWYFIAAHRISMGTIDEEMACV